MSLDGLRAWIGVVERKLTMRTRVFCVLVAIAIGGAAAGIFLAVEAQDEAVTKSDLQAVRDEVAAAPETAPATGQLEAEVATLREEIGQLRGELAGGEGGAQKGSASGGEGGGGKTGGATAPQSKRELKEAGEEAIEEAGK